MECSAADKHWLLDSKTSTTIPTKDIDSSGSHKRKRKLCKDDEDELLSTFKRQKTSMSRVKSVTFSSDPTLRISAATTTRTLQRRGRKFVLPKERRIPVKTHHNKRQRLLMAQISFKSENLCFNNHHFFYSFHFGPHITTHSNSNHTPTHTNRYKTDKQHTPTHWHTTPQTLSCQLIGTKPTHINSNLPNPTYSNKYKYQHITTITIT